MKYRVGEKSDYLPYIQSKPAITDWCWKEKNTKKEKIIRVIKGFLGEECLVAHAETLKYDIEKARLAKNA